ncbi:MAG: hypothetical protein OXF66_11005 [Gammaproteobacteria bacterium]|nr:hypothetical protein [Gammaproteobacteria bacterium]MCY4255729.1 hypothetical protein [Gammaproteobacteria bacterium]MCY4341791.1 hypothetical protein [Gammaproteobacteria bacterium]
MPDVIELRARFEERWRLAFGPCGCPAANRGVFEILEEQTIGGYHRA